MLVLPVPTSPCQSMLIDRLWMSNPNPEVIEKELLWADGVTTKGVETFAADCLASSLSFALFGSVLLLC